MVELLIKKIKKQSPKRTPEEWVAFRSFIASDFNRVIEVWDFFMTKQKKGRVQTTQKYILDKVLRLNPGERSHWLTLYACLKRMEEEGLIKIDKTHKPFTYILNQDAMQYFVRRIES